MSANSKIEWTDHSFNPWIGCTKKSPGCKNCYAEARDNRFAGGKHWGKGAPRERTGKATWRSPVRWNNEAGKWGAFHHGVLCCSGTEQQMRNKVDNERRARRGGSGRLWLGWEARRLYDRAPRVFPSLCDWLDGEVPIEWLADFLRLIFNTPNLMWLLLTKSPENFRSRLLQAFTWICDANEAGPWSIDCEIWLQAWLNRETPNPPNNVWIGVSAEDQKRWDERVEILGAIPAAVRFVSAEPLLEHIDAGNAFDPPPDNSPYSPVDWVIIGGESGPGARPCNTDWIRNLMTQCTSSDVPVFVKQLGGRPIEPIFDARNHPIGHRRVDLRDRKGGDPSEWPEDLRIREFPKA